MDLKTTLRYRMVKEGGDEDEEYQRQLKDFQRIIKARLNEHLINSSSKNAAGNLSSESPL